jgi:hypothetical protein
MGPGLFQVRYLIRGQLQFTLMLERDADDRRAAGKPLVRARPPAKSPLTVAIGVQ